jgi:hypothetical protein
MIHSPLRPLRLRRFPGNAVLPILFSLLSSIAFVEATWLESATPLVGPALLQVRATNRQVILRIRTGESVSRTVAFFMRRDAPFTEASDLTNAFLVDRVRTAGGSTTFVPDDNGVYYGAALVYVSADAVRQSYQFLISEDGAEVDWVPPRLPPMPFPTPPVAPASHEAPKAVASEPRETNAPAKPIEPEGVRSNAPAAAAPATSVNVAVQWPSNYFLPFLAAMNPPQPPSDKMNLSARDFLSALTNLLAEKKTTEEPRPERDRYFSRDPDAVELEELSACSRELRDLFGALARHRREALPVTESEVYPMLLSYGNAVLRLEQCFIRIMQRGIKLAEAERLQSDFAEVNRELLELWRRLDERLKEAVLGKGS